MKQVNLFDISTPKQWKTIPATSFTQSGFPVYGANGKIGFYSEYNHFTPTLMITCRGATCGSLNISEPQSYITGNAMALDNLDENMDLKYLYYYFKTRGFNDVISGSAQPQITREGLAKVFVPVLPIEQQLQISNSLDQADSLRQKRKQAIDLLDEYLKSIFLEMFGNTVTNPKSWEVKTLSEMVEFMTSGSRGWAKYYSNNGSIFLTIKNVSRAGKLLLDDITYVNAPNNAEAKRTKVKDGDVLLSITADLGRTAVVDKLPKEAYINQHLVILRLKPNYQPYYVSSFLSTDGGQIQMQKMNKGASKAGLNFNDIKSIKVFIPPIELQNKFTKIIFEVENLKQKMLEQAYELDNQFYALMQNAFNENN